MLHIIVVMKVNPKFSSQGKNFFFFYFLSIGDDECVIFTVVIIS